MNNHTKVMMAAAGIFVLGIIFVGAGSEKLLPFILLLCPLSMIIMMVFMGKGGHKH